MKKITLPTLSDFRLTIFQRIVLGLFSVGTIVVFLLGSYSDSQVRCLQGKILLYVPIFLLLIEYLCYKMMRFIPSLCNYLITSSEEETKQYPWMFWLVGNVYICAIILCLHCMGNDATSQWHQVLTCKFSDWHPVTHTFLVWLITCIWRNDLCFLILQGVFFITLLAFFWQKLVHTCKIRPSIAILVTLVLTTPPHVHCFLREINKDATELTLFFAIAILMISIADSQGAWLSSLRHTLLFSCPLVLGTLIRHNGFFFTLPLLFCMPFFCEKKYWLHWLRLLLVCLAIYIPIKFFIIPKYSMRTGNPEVNQYFCESVGIPMAMLAHIYTNAPRETLSQPFVDFMSNLTTPENWKNYKPRFGVNLLKWKEPHYLTYLSHFGPQRFFKIFLAEIKCHPTLAFNGLFLNIIWPWQPNGYPGLCLYCILFTAIIVFPYIKWKVLPFVLPVLAYHIGTSLLLYGQDYRYFLFLIALTPPFILTMLHLTDIEIKHDSIHHV